MHKNFILFFAIAFSSTLLGQHITINKTPDWVIQETFNINSEVSKYDVSSGAYFELMDYQYNLETGSDYTHEIINILSYGGVKNASEIYITYDSAYQKVDFHYLYIWRKGQKIDRTNDLTFELLNNEQSLSDGVYTGQITAYDILEDIRVDDKIEFAYTIHGDNPIYNGKLYRYVSLEYDNPIDYLSARVFYPKKEEYTWRCNACEDVTIKETSTKQFEQVHLIRKNIKAIELEESIPPWHIPFKHFVISGFKNWASVKEWSHDVFALNEPQDLSAVFDEIFTGTESLDQKIDAIINFAQNDIRYMGVEAGMGSIKPFPPMQVIKQRFGDCKDKSLLVATLLKQIGVNSCYPALVSTNLQHNVDTLLAGAQVFDHVIVYLEHEGKSYWIDPTIPQQGGNYKTKVITDYGLALIVDGKENGLSAMNYMDTTSGTEVVETINIDSFDKPGDLTVVSKLYGQNADILRQMLEYYSLKDLSDQLKSLYAMVFQHIEVSERLKIEDQLEENVITLTEHYSISDVWRESNTSEFGAQLKMLYEPVSLYNYMNLQECSKKKFPVYVRYPGKYNQITNIVLPEAISFEPEFVSKSNAAFNFSKGTILLGGTKVIIMYKYEAKAKQISPAQYVDVCKESNEIVRDFPIEVYYTKSLLEESLEGN